MAASRSDEKTHVISHRHKGYLAGVPRKIGGNSFWTYDREQACKFVEHVAHEVVRVHFQLDLAVDVEPFERRA